ncbi:MAG: 3-oxoacyl-[acyl-carrier-protein] synthase III C-terminal domain-containing protein [Pseudodonghicola sp.]|nr:3-oxoacyl-[acyl-carrier-protein] synthase III C-terminal domain-containing protein [Pseudodonghicola sp.]
MTGLTSIGTYVPRLRLARKTILAAQGKPSGSASGERAICNWDEDSLTMAVEAARACLGDGPASVTGITLASTTLPFEERQNATIVATALDLAEGIRSMDTGGTQRAGTSALIAAIDMVGADGGDRLVVASDHRLTKSASPQELRFGDGAGAVTVGAEAGLAEVLATHTLSVDFIDHYRGQGRPYDYYWEERWIRDEGYLKLIPQALNEALGKASIAPEDVDHAILPQAVPKAAAAICKRVGLRPDSLADSLQDRIGDTGVAHPFLMLAGVLETAQKGEIIALVGFGQGCDVIVLRATGDLRGQRGESGLGAGIARRSEMTNYTKYLAFNGLIEKDEGMRGEVDYQSAMTQIYRRRDMLLAMVGGICPDCQTPQFPRSRVCVNPGCASFATQERYRFADKPATVVSWSADHLTYTPDPPARYGLIQFEGGGRIFANFTDVDGPEVDVGTGMRMVFRIKEFDHKRGFRRYFWKATPKVGHTAQTGGAA